ncbi:MULTISPECIES: cupin domain-containing protein [unclassified Haladaptatus]|uniref:cupin domain-containing protein n=1 Tax=unclassified Haladaptatus TaxID=2622732 RepID=UPI0023E7CFB2|nr:MULTISPECIES: cupin domain-containing protein [unclassified Haladaptatus]
MHAKVNLDEIDVREVGEESPRLKAVGYELRPQKMRPNVWVFEQGDWLNRHKQKTQEELYHVLSGTFEMRYETETEELNAGDIVVVSPEEIRQLVCVKPGEVFIVGAPNVKDDGIVLNED